MSVTERRKFVLGSETHRQFVGSLGFGDKNSDRLLRKFGSRFSSSRGGIRSSAVCNGA